MANFNFPYACAFIFKLCEANPELQALAAQFEDALKENVMLREIYWHLQPQCDNMKMELHLLRQAANSMDGCHQQNIGSQHLIQTCFDQLLDMESLIRNGSANNISRYAMLQKQTAVQAKLLKLETALKEEVDSKLFLESRQIVKDCRQSEHELGRLKMELLSMQRKSEQLEFGWQAKLEMATQKRNKQIVTLVQLSQQLHELRQKSSGQAVSEAAKQQPDARLQTSSGRAVSFDLQSALDFLNNYPKPRESPQLRSILMDKPPQLRSILIDKRSSSQASSENSDRVKHVTFVCPDSSSDSSMVDEPFKGMAFVPMDQQENQTDTVMRPEKASVISVVDEPFKGMASVPMDQQENQTATVMRPEKASVISVVELPPISFNNSSLPSAQPKFPSSQDAVKDSTANDVDMENIDEDEMNFETLLQEFASDSEEIDHSSMQPVVSNMMPPPALPAVPKTPVALEEDESLMASPATMDFSMRPRQGSDDFFFSDTDTQKNKLSYEL